jgi:hypothetical protein
VRIRIPGLAGATGGDIMFSEAAMPWMSGFPLLVVDAACDVGGVWAPAEVEVVVVVGDLESDSGVMVDVEEEREKVLARGARCVSFSSIHRQFYPHARTGPCSNSCVYKRTLGKFPRHLGVYLSLARILLTGVVVVV